MGLDPDHCNKVNTAISASHEFFGFPVNLKVTFLLYLVHQVCNSSMSKKSNENTLIEKYLVAKSANHHLSLLQIWHRYMAQCRFATNLNAMSVKHNKTRYASITDWPYFLGWTEVKKMCLLEGVEIRHLKWKFPRQQAI